jgi:acyl-CoA thioesterase
MVYEDPFSDLLGFEVLVANGGGVKVRCVVKPEHTNAAGTAHGGLLYTLADVAFALAVNPPGRSGVGISTHMENFRPVRESEAVVAETVELNSGRRLATYRVDLRREDDGKPVACFTGTAYLTSDEEGNER